MKKLVVFCCIFLFLGTGLAFSQRKQIASERHECYELTVRGVDYASSVKDIYLYLYDDNTYQFAINYYNSIVEYLYLRDGKMEGNVARYNDVSMADSNGNRTYNLWGNVIGGTYLTLVTIYRGREKILDLSLRN